MMKTGTQLLNAYEITKQLHSDDSNGIEYYVAFDTQQKKDVMVKSYLLPEDPHLRNIARRLWSHEIRLTHRATSMAAGKSLLQIVDARTDKNNERLFIISEKGQERLSHVLSHRDEYKFMDVPSSSRLLWRGFLELADAMVALHETGLLHRNICPESIVLGDMRKDDDPLFFIGDFSWSVYLHGLVKMLAPDALEQSERDITLFQSPELINPKDFSYESFSSDVFSMGMIFVACFIPELDLLRVRPRHFDDCKKSLQVVVDTIERSGHLRDDEKKLLSHMIEIEPTERIRDFGLVCQEIERILRWYIEDQIPKEHDLMPVTAWLEKLSENLIDRSDLDIKQIVNEPETFFKDEFRGAEVYASNDEKFPLTIVTVERNIYRLQPWANTKRGYRNDRIAKVFTSNRYFKVPDSKPLLILQRGLCLVTSGEVHYAKEPSWSRHFGKAIDLIKAHPGKGEPKEKLIKQLTHTLDAQCAYDCRFVYPYKIVDQTAKKNTIEIEVEIARTYEHHSYGHITTASLVEFEEMLRKEGQLYCDLSETPHPYEKFSIVRWEIRKIKKNGLTLRTYKKTDSPMPSIKSNGYLRPWVYRYASKLFIRKKRAIKSLNENTYLKDVLLHPERMCLYPEDVNKYSASVINKIVPYHPISLVQGPPGTGKTWLACEAIAKILSDDSSARILVTAKDHEPLDHLLSEVSNRLRKEKIVPAPLLVRQVSPEREMVVDSSSTAFGFRPKAITSDILTQSIECLGVRSALQIEGDSVEQWKAFCQSQKMSPSRRTIDLVQRSANVFFATSTSSVIGWLPKNVPPYDWVIFEESGKAYPTELLLPMLLGHRWLLIGDQRQLPPFRYREIVEVIDQLVQKDSDEYRAWSFEDFAKYRDELVANVKFFDSLYRRIKNSQYLYLPSGIPAPVHRLEDQYRLPPMISDLISKTFYDTTFVHKRSSPQIGDPFTEPKAVVSKELIWLDTPHCSVNSEAKESGHCRNIIEIQYIMKLLRSFKSPTPFNENIAIISPYKEQVESLQRHLQNFKVSIVKSNLATKCYTVDSFQGRQADIVIVSLVRNNFHEDMRKALGFVTAEERLNVMLSRARKRMIIIGCSTQFETFKDSSDTKALIDVISYCKQNGLIVPVSVLGKVRQ